MRMICMLPALLSSAAGITAAVRGQWGDAAVCLGTLLLMPLPELLARRMRLRLTAPAVLLWQCFLFGAGVLGEARGFYLRFVLWDVWLHALSGILFAAAGFAVCASGRKKVPADALPAFCFSVTAGVIWEFIEFAADRLFALDMQKDTVLNGFQSVLLDPARSGRAVAVRGITRTVIAAAEGQLVLPGYLDIGLTDTVKDLFTGTAAAAVFAAVCAVQLRRGRKGLALSLIPEEAEKASHAPARALPERM